MAASKRLIQLASRLRAIHVGSTMNTPTLRRTSVNSYRFLSSSSSFHESECRRKQEQGLTELHSLRSEIIQLKFDIRKMRMKLEFESDESKRLILETKNNATKYAFLGSLLGALGIFLCFPGARPVAVELPPLLFLSLIYLFPNPLVFFSLILCCIVSHDLNGRKARKGRDGRDSTKENDRDGGDS